MDPVLPRDPAATDTVAAGVEADVRVLTLVKGRDGHLRNLLAGLARGTRLPGGCVVVDMSAVAAGLPATPFPTLVHRCPSDGLPLARARNLAASLAGDAAILVFLDVDCVPAAGLVQVMAAQVRARDALLCCEIRYLPAGATAAGIGEAGLERLGLRHPVRDFPARGVAVEANAGLFWSLAFAVRRDTFERLGGFDEGFTGYGGEDTDLSFRARAAGVPLLFTGDTRAFHQHHAIHDPPLQHFDDILRNAWRFRERHGFWPMRGWLDAFAGLGLIAPAGEGPIRVLRRPDAAEVAAALCPPGRVY